jgi:hypothetical protein
MEEGYKIYIMMQSDKLNLKKNSTLSVPLQVSLYIWSKSNSQNLTKLIEEKYTFLEDQINIIRFIFNFIFIIYLFCIVNIDNFIYKYAQI